MSHYPVALELADRPVLVVGGGPVAERKVDGALAADARVTVVSPRVTARLAALAGAGRIRYLAREYRPGDVEGHDLVLVAVDEEAVTAAVVTEARARRIWVNAADDPLRCDFVLPAILRRGALVVAVTTGGASPALARAVRDRLARLLGEEYAELTALVAEVRRELCAADASPGAEAWHRALADDLPELVRGGHAAEAGRRLRERLGAG